MEFDDDVAAAPHDARPGPDTEVLDDNVYELRLAQSGASMSPTLSMLGSQEGSIERARASPRAATLSRRTSPGPSQRSSIRQTPRSGIKKRVSFSGVPQPMEPWVPPHRRKGLPPRQGAGSSSQEEDAGLGSGGGAGAGPRRQQQQRRQPDHAVHPERYVRYDLEHPLTVGGGIGQMAGEEEEGQAAAAAAAVTAAHSAPENEQPLERWQGEVGAGGVQFRGQRRQGEGVGDGAKRESSGGGCWDGGEGAEGEDAGELRNNGGGAAKQRRHRAPMAAQFDDDDEMDDMSP